MIWFDLWKWKRSGLEIDRVAYRKACRHANILITKSRADHFRQQLLSASNCRRRWQIAKELLHADKSKLSVDCVSCEHFADFFKSKIENLTRAVATAASKLRPSAVHLDLPFTGTPLDILPPLDIDTVSDLIRSTKPKSSCVDYIPTSLLKSCPEVFGALLCRLANLSFTEGVFPHSFKLAAVSPLLKKAGLDQSLPSNYRPISNLNNISKILERLFLISFQSHVTSCPAFNRLQSAYRPRHSTETALIHTLNHIYSAADRGKPSLLVSLDLSAAFDTISHSILLSRLQSSFGTSGPALAWLKSYLSDRTQIIRIGSSSSSVYAIDSGVPQGSVLGPILFSVYVSPIGSIASQHNLLHQQYADDAQFFIELSSPTCHPDVHQLELGLQHLHNWLCANGLCLNPDKSDAILFGTSKRLQSFSHVTQVNVAGCPVALSNSIVTLGVTLDQCLNLNAHVSAICRSSFFHIKAIRHCRASLPIDVRVTLATALVQSRLDYANSVLLNTTEHNLQKLQRIQNYLAKSIFPVYPPIPSAELVHSLHWLPIKDRINFKVAVLVYGLLNSHQPTYLTDLLSHRPAARTLRSADYQLLDQPRCATAFGGRAFAVTAPRIWNAIPLDIRSAPSVDAFRRQLKTYLFTNRTAV